MERKKQDAALVKKHEHQLTYSYDRYPACLTCGFDHALSPTQAYNQHTELLVREITTKLTSFAKSVHAIRLSSSVVHKCMRDTLRASMMLIDPEFLYDKLRLSLEEEGLEVKW
jgi:hypothetical protein